MGNLSSKIKRGIQKSKTKLIVALAIWFVLVLIFIAPITVAIGDASTAADGFNLTEFISSLTKHVTNPFGCLGIAFSEYIATFFKTLGWFTLIYAVVAMVGIFRSMPKTEYADIEHGSSDWCEGGEQYQVLSPKSGIILAEKNYLPVDKRGNVNVLVVGGSGSGKSASYVIPNAYQLLGSYVFTDPKGELYDKTAGYMKANGYDIKVLNLVSPRNSDGYNPLMHISNEIDVDVIANTIVKGQKSESNSDPYWDDMAEMLLKALIYYLMATRPMEEQNLSSCAELVRAANSGNGDNLLTNLISVLPYDHPARMNYKSIEIAPEKTYSSILSSLQSKLGKFDSREIAELTSTDTINFEEIGSRKTAVYVISSDTHTAYDFLLTIFFSQMIQQLYDFADKNGGALKVPTYFILDEFANIGRIPDFDKKISTSRSRKISFSVILQNLDQLEAVYKESHETIIGNCDTHLFLGSNSQKTVEYFSKALGEKTISRESISINRDRERNRQGFSESDQIMARALLTPDELRRFDNDYCIIYEKGIKPVKAHKYYYFEYATAKYAKQYPANHNDVTVERGKWRKFNPYKPYVEDEEPAKNNTIQSIDSMLEEEPQQPKAGNSNNNVGYDEPINISNIGNEEEQPQQSSKRDDFEELDVDVQKELEAKFDEIFGAFDNDETTSNT